MYKIKDLNYWITKHQKYLFWFVPLFLGILRKKSNKICKIQILKHCYAIKFLINYC